MVEYKSTKKRWNGTNELKALVLYSRTKNFQENFRQAVQNWLKGIREKGSFFHLSLNQFQARKESDTDVVEVAVSDSVDSSVTEIAKHYKVSRPHRL